METTDKIYQHVKTMPSEMADEVLDFVKFLKYSKNTEELEILKMTESDDSRLPLGKQLMALRQRAIAEGITLLSEDEILAEVKKRRGEI